MQSTKHHHRLEGLEVADLAAAAAAAATPERRRLQHLLIKIRLRQIFFCFALSFGGKCIINNELSINISAFHKKNIHVKL